MKLEISKEELAALEIQHKKERDSRVRDRIKVALLRSEGWMHSQIAQALRIRIETVQEHLNDYVRSKKLKPENGGSESKLTEGQTSELVQHLELSTYTKVSEICSYVQSRYSVSYTVSGMTQWLHAHQFSYKKPQPTPAKASATEQERFIAEYNNLLAVVPEDEPVLFVDAVHPTQATKISYGWIKKGTDKPIATTGSRARMNIVGALELATMNLVASEYETINAQSMCQYLAQVRAQYQNAPQIHVILDRDPASAAKETKDAAKQHGITLHYLPPYSPNLNPIERVWKVMNERSRNNRFFHSANEFRQAIRDFFNVIWPKISQSMRCRITDNFQRVKEVPSG